MTTTTEERAAVKRATRRLGERHGLNETQVEDAVDLTVSLYRMAEHHGVDRALMDAVSGEAASSFPVLAITAILARDSRHGTPAVETPAEVLP